MCETERQAEMEFIEFLKFTEQDDSEKYEMLKESACEIRALENKNKQLKEVIEDIRNCVEYNPNQMSEDATYDLLQILDKVKV